MIERLCVFCGSNPGFDPAYRGAAEALGEALVEQGIGLVYGGASIGLMGALANVVQNRGGSVIGVIPQALVEKEVAHRGIGDLRIVATMHERKAAMADLADAFVALPGGVGTLEELFEVWTWAQLGHHRKACALLNVAGFYDQLLAFLDRVVHQGFMKGVHRDILMVADNPSSLLKQLAAYDPPQVTKWLSDAAP